MRQKWMIMIKLEKKSRADTERKAHESRIKRDRHKAVGGIGIHREHAQVACRIIRGFPAWPNAISCSPLPRPGGPAFVDLDGGRRGEKTHGTAGDASRCDRAGHARKPSGLAGEAHEIVAWQALGTHKR